MRERIGAKHRQRDRRDADFSGILDRQSENHGANGGAGVDAVAAKYLGRVGGNWSVSRGGSADAMVYAAIFERGARRFA